MSSSSDHQPSAASRTRRFTRRAALLPVGSRCATCQTSDVLTLSQPQDGQIQCYACAARARGMSGYEAHHVWGRQVDPQVVRTPANLHRALSEAQYAWDPAVLRNRDRRPVLLLVGFLYFLRDVGRLVAAQCQAFVDWLLGVHARAVARDPHYETTWGFPRLTGEA